MINLLTQVLCITSLLIRIVTIHHLTTLQAGQVLVIVIITIIIVIIVIGLDLHSQCYHYQIANR